MSRGEIGGVYRRRPGISGDILYRAYCRRAFYLDRRVKSHRAATRPENCIPVVFLPLSNSPRCAPQQPYPFTFACGGSHVARRGNASRLTYRVTSSPRYVTAYRLRRYRESSLAGSRENLPVSALLRRGRRRCDVILFGFRDARS